MNERYLERAFEDAHIIELRHQSGTRWTSGTFNNIDRLFAAINEWRDDGNLYTTLNRPIGIKATNKMNARALSDADIGVITRIPFDFDPDRPTNTPATDEERVAAAQARTACIGLLDGFGWPMPAIADSGNGCHLVYRVRLKNDDDWKNAAGVLYKGIQSRLADALTGVSFDTTVRNPARIFRLYGTMNRKGAETPDRQHRMASIRLPAAAWQIVPVPVLKRTIRALRPLNVSELVRRNSRPGRPHGSGDYKTLDALAWFQAHGAYRGPLADGKHIVDCPWSNEHTTSSPTSTVIWTRGDSGWPTFHCSHAHCDGRKLGDVMELWGDADDFCAQEYSHA